MHTVTVSEEEEEEAEEGEGEGKTADDSEDECDSYAQREEAHALAAIYADAFFFFSSSFSPLSSADQGAEAAGGAGDDAVELQNVQDRGAADTRAGGVWRCGGGDAGASALADAFARSSSCAPRRFRVRVGDCAFFSWRCPRDYPSRAPPAFALDWTRELIDAAVEGLFERTGDPRKDVERAVASDIRTVEPFEPGRVVVFQWINCVQERTREVDQALRAWRATRRPSPLSAAASPSAAAPDAQPLQFEEFVFLHGPVVQDRQSTFQAHLLRLPRSCDEANTRSYVARGRAALLQERKIARATHSMWAWRCMSRVGLISGGGDDGEKGAFDAIMGVLLQRDAVDVLVVVSRWYGGVHLGGARFRHIREVAYRILDQAARGEE